MKAQLLDHIKRLYADDTVMEIVIWKLPNPDQNFPHGHKYRLHYGKLDGDCIVRYDNEKGKGDHRHFYDTEEPYVFTTIDQLTSDFFADIAKSKRHKK